MFCMSDGTYLYPHALAHPESGKRKRPAPFVQTNLDAGQKQSCLTREVTKWFEPRVTVRFHSPPTPWMKHLVDTFFTAVNTLSGRSRFHLLDGEGPAHIIIETTPRSQSENPLRMVGETSGLTDRLRVHLIPGENGLRIEEFQATARSQPRNSLNVQFTPDELNILKTRRMVKVVIQSHTSPILMRRILIHELLHAIGIPGHSPFRASALFPIIPSIEGREAGHSLLTPLESTLVEMLYRPETLPGMSLEEAGRTLASVRRRRWTHPQDTRDFLTRRRDHLELEKQRLLHVWRESFSASMELLVQLEGLRLREQNFLEEWRELYEDEGRKTLIIDLAEKARTFAIRRSILRFSILQLEKRLPLEKYRGKRSLIREEIGILTDLLSAGEAANAFEIRIQGQHGFQLPGEREEEKRMRRLVRQLKAIKQELDRLNIWEAS